MKFKKLGAVLGVKGILCIAALSIVALALVSYTSRLTIMPVKQFTLGASVGDWTIYVNDVEQVRYLPANASAAPLGSGKPGNPTDDPSKFSFKVVTDENKVCAVKIELTAPANSTVNFTTFEIRVLIWGATDWQSIDLYAAETGTTTKDFINGLIPGDAGYIHQAIPEADYYLIQVTYTYNDDATALVYVDFKYTPLPQDSIP